MQFKPPLCWQVLGRKISQGKTHTREFVFSKLFLKLPKMVPGQLQVLGQYADEHGGHSEKAAQASTSTQKFLTPPIITLVKSLHKGRSNLTCLPSFSPDPHMKPTPGCKCALLSSILQEDIFGS